MIFIYYKDFLNELDKDKTSDCQNLCQVNNRLKKGQQLSYSRYLEMQTANNYCFIFLFFQILVRPMQ